ncbi:helix-turn-helix transcriptional regulator [Streptomyces filamentosus]|uniref:helix-turn-helix transcriptional regulator n=1 Tax=Streptomyces filamentosus TaxID=67294 RepID=UPI00123ABF99|nr:helix-turn-helix domain-containing protein [Streptomyces filamentosus]KAA6211750.1 DNA-binding protein [Streptomyces filamentosus]KAA6220042.1 DNA-binding protein [Streptomyces filamentosus]
MSSTIADPSLMDTKELADFLKISPAALRQLRYRGRAPKGFRRGRNTLYRRAEVDRWLAAMEAGDRLAQRAAA